jgi:hypothetical protein
MIRWELIVLYVLVMSDIIFTYLLMYKTKVNKMTGYVEFNPVVRRLVDKHGLHKGIRISALYAFGLLTLCFLYLFWRVPPADFSRLVFFAMGMFSLMNIIHVSSLVVVNDAIEKKKN